MSTNYKHGAYGTIGATVITGAKKAMTAPVYISTAPVNLIRGYANAGVINKPVELDNIGAKEIIGYSNNWSTFTLCEVIKAHFDNAKGNIGPIYVINVLDPATHRKTIQTSKQLTFVNGRASIESDTIILDTFAMEDKAEGVDYNLSYNFITGKVIISSADSANKLSGTVTAAYFEVDPTLITEEDVIGGKTADGVYTGIQAAALLYPTLAVIPNLFAAPGWSNKPAVKEALETFVQQINGHWYAFAMIDIPITDNSSAVDTIEKAVAWKNSNGYDSMFIKPWWPMVKSNDGLIYHLSTLAVVEALRTDNNHGGIPMETCSNKSVPVSVQYFGSTSKNQGFDQNEANLLNEEGISTVVPWGGEYVLWGPHTGAFKAGADGNVAADVDALAIFDVNVRMQEYILNSFQSEWATVVDGPIDKGLQESILNREQEKLDALVAIGALIGNPKVEFLETNNTTTNLMNGNFKWNFSDTPTPPAKVLSAEVSYADAGFSAFFGEEE